MTEIEKLDLNSMNIAEDKVQKIKQLFPEVFTESNKIDFDKLKLSLGESIDTGKERYGINWPGKADCFKIIQQPSIGTLIPVRKESVNFDTTENLFIEGDNLEALKLLQKSYLGKIKMIYIDPPYNTGNDFIYPDNYSESLETYLRYTGQLDSEGRRYSTNTETDGRFHSKWLSMMYPRLFLARNLLREDGVIFISIDDNEVDNLKKICNEIFGEENFMGQIAIQSNPRGRQSEKFFATTHEYLLSYCKNIEECNLSGLKLSEDQLSEFNLIDENNGKYRFLGLRQRGAASLRSDRPLMYFPIYVNPNTNKVSLEKNSDFFIEVFPKKSSGEDGRWMWSKKKVQENLELVKGKLISGRNEYDIFIHDYLNKNGVERARKAKTIWDEKEINYQNGNNEIKELFGMPVMDYPKPVYLIRKAIEVSSVSEEDEIVLDFFAGSCTTAHAVVEQNKEDGGNRKFICIQLPEPIEENSEAFKAGYKTIADAGKERIRRVIQKIKKEIKDNKLSMFPEKNPKLDLGFKVFKLSTSNFKVWDTNAPKEKEAIQKQLSLHVDHINHTSSQEDILYEILLKSGFPLTTKIEQVTLAGKTVFSIAEGAMLICLEKELAAEVIKAIAKRQPIRVVCLDAGFKGNDQLKTNAVQIMKSKKITDFRTV